MKLELYVTHFFKTAFLFRRESLVSVTKTDCLMLLMNMTTAYASHKHTFTCCVSKIPNFSLFNQ